jgi:hypothetical protein
VRLWIAPREFDSLRSPHCLGGRSAARTRVFEACYGSSSLPLPTRLTAQRSSVARQTESSRGRRSTDQDTRLRTGRLGGSNPPARTIFGSSSKGQGTALRRLRFRFDPGRAGHHLRSVGRLARCPAVYRAQASSILARSAKAHGDVDKLAKSPALQAGHRGFESRHRHHWPEAHEAEQAILNRQAASSILARPTKVFVG